MAKMIGLARLGRDAEVRYTNGGEPVCSLSLAFTYGKKGDDGKRPTQWIDASFWGKRGESLAQYLAKGSQHVFTLEDIHIETFQGKNGEGVKLAARCVDVELVAGQNQEGQHSQSNSRQDSAPRSAPAPQRNSQAAPPVSFDDMDDDLPFAPIGRGRLAYVI